MEPEKTKLNPLVLLVDDEPQYHQNLIFAFGEYDFISVYNAEVAIQIAGKMDLDLIIIDLNLDITTDKKFHGIELIGAIRKFDKEVPIVVVTMYHDMLKDFDLEKRSIKAGANKFLLKKDYNLTVWKDVFETCINQN